MSEPTFDAFTRRAAAAVSRRSSLATFGGAALAASLLAPTVNAAQNKAKKAKKKARKKCRNQQGQCETSVQAFCNLPPNATAVASVSAEGMPTCFELLSPCCTFLSTCNASASTTCFLQFVPIHG
jgi:hypothetical protein